MIVTEQDQHWMQYTINLAHKARESGEVPVGACVIFENKVIGEGWNRPIALHDPSAHAEIIALRAAAINLQNYRLPGTTLYATLEPCGMCAVAMVHARIDRLVYGAYDPKAGAVGSVYNALDMAHVNHKIAVTKGICEAECSELLTRFFRAKRGEICDVTQ